MSLDVDTIRKDFPILDVEVHGRRLVCILRQRQKLGGRGARSDSGRLADAPPRSIWTSCTR